MICPSCDFANPEGFKFCGHCAGALLTRARDAFLAMGARIRAREIESQLV